MDKQGTIETMLEAVYTIKVSGIRGAGLEALYELRDLCEKLIAIHACQKRAPGHFLNGDKAAFSIVSEDSKEHP